MSAETILLGLLGGFAVCVLRDVLPVFVAVKARIEQEGDCNIAPHQNALGLYSLGWRAVRCWVTGRVAVVQLPNGCMGIGVDPPTRLLPRPAAFALGVALVIAVHHVQPGPPSAVLASIAVLALLLIALTSFDHRLVADGAVIVVALTGIGNAVMGEGALPMQALTGLLVGLGIAWAIRSVAGLAGWEPFGYAIPKLTLAIGVWAGAYGVALAMAVAAGLALIYWIVQTIGWASGEETLPVGGFLSLAGVGVLLLGAA